jgi:regulatory protein
MMSECKYSFHEAQVKLESWCAYQDRCTFEIESKLASWNIPVDQYDQLIEHLVKNRFLDDKRFSESFVSGKVKIKRWGRIKIKHYLIQKRLSKELITFGLSTIDSELYWNNLIDLTSRRLQEAKRNEDKWHLRKRTATFLASKGYEQDLIFEAIKTCENQISID